MKDPWVRLLGGVLLLLCGGCATPAPAPEGAPNPNLRLALNTTPHRPRSLDPTAFTVRVTDARGHSLSGAGVQVRLEMPAMPMGDDEVEMKSGGAGTYTGTGRFTMAGTWRATVTAARGTQRATQAFRVAVR